MPDQLTQHNIGALGDLVRLSLPATGTAAGAGDATTVTGVTIDRFSFSNGSMPRSALMGVLWEATLTTAKTLAIGYAVQDSADGSTWADYQTATYATVANGSSGLTPVGQFNVQVDLNSARRFVRFNFNPDLNNSATDTFVTRAAGFFGGFDRLPAPNA